MSNEHCKAMKLGLDSGVDQVTYTGNGTAGRENMTAPTGFFFQMPKAEKHEPFVWLEDDKGNKYPMPEKNKGPLLKRAEEAFESAKKREWVGLADEEFDVVVPYCHNEFDLQEYKDFARAIESKLKEKNT